MPGHGPIEYPCILCNKRIKPNERRLINKGLTKTLRKCFMIKRTDTRVICQKSRHKYNKINTAPKLVPQRFKNDSPSNTKECYFDFTPDNNVTHTVHTVSYVKCQDQIDRSIYGFKI